MRKYLTGLVLLASVVLAGCSGSWWQNFKNDPVAQVQTFENSAQTALAVAAIAWNSLRATLPPDVAAKAQLRYEQAMLSVNKAFVVLDDAVHVAVEVHQTTPDFIRLIQLVSDAVEQVVAIVNEFRTVPRATASSTPQQAVVGLEDLSTAVLTMKRVGGTK